MTTNDWIMEALLMLISALSVFLVIALAYGGKALCVC